MQRTMAALLLFFSLTSCKQSGEPPAPRPQQAGQPIDPVKMAARVAATRAAAITGDQEAVQANLHAMNEDFRKSIRLADPARRVDRESARLAARQVESVRSVAWIDHENLLAIVSRNDARSYATIDAICMRLEPLGDTLGVVVNLQSGAASNGDELEILSRNCQLAPGDRALLQRNRQVDVLAPEVRAQHRANSEATQAEAARRQREAEESLRIIEASTAEI